MNLNKINKYFSISINNKKTNNNTLNCKHFNDCSGCTIIKLPTSPIIKQANLFFNSINIYDVKYHLYPSIYELKDNNNITSDLIHTTNKNNKSNKNKNNSSIYNYKPFNWRTSVKLAVQQDINNNIVIGLYKIDSHIVQSIPNCMAHNSK
jgi:hypothetical protein